MNKRIIVNGACGRMGNEVVKTVVNDTEDQLVGAFDQKNIKEDIIAELGLKGYEILIQDNLEQLINDSNPDVIIDFTSPEIVMDNIEIGLKSNVHMIVGTTGITEADMKKIKNLSENNDANILVAPNFAIGAVLLMEFAREASEYLPDVEIIELHHDQKIDSPSGTSIKTAELINEKRINQDKKSVDEIEKMKGARGANKDGVHIHSVRLPGLIAHQEVIFGGEGQSLKIRHDSYDRSSFMPGVRLALKKITDINNFVYGLEKII